VQFTLAPIGVSSFALEDVDTACGGFPEDGQDEVECVKVSFFAVLRSDIFCVQ